MLVIKNCRSFYQSLLQFIVAFLAAVDERKRQAEFHRDMQRLDAHLLADIGLRRTPDQEVVSIDNGRVNTALALAGSHRRQARLKTAFLVRRRQLLRNGRSGP